MAIATIAAIGSAVAAGIGAASSVSQKNKRSGRAASDFQQAYDPVYQQTQETLFAQSQQQADTLARSGGTAGSQASATSQAIAMTPEMTRQANLGATQAATGYAQAQGDYRAQQLAEDESDSERLWGGISGGLSAIGQLSDKRSKKFKKRVGKDIGHPGSYGDGPPVTSDHGAKNVMSDERSKAEIATLKADKAGLEAQMAELTANQVDTRQAAEAQAAAPPAQPAPQPSGTQDQWSTPVGEGNQPSAFRPRDRRDPPREPLPGTRDQAGAPAALRDRARSRMSNASHEEQEAFVDFMEARQDRKTGGGGPRAPTPPQLEASAPWEPTFNFEEAHPYQEEFGPPAPPQYYDPREDDPRVSSDKRTKTYSDEDMKNQGGGEGRAMDVFRNTPGSAFEYKEEYQDAPGAERGPQYGVMAQDLEKTPEGATVVDEDEQGMKRVDTGRLALLQSAALEEIIARLDRMEAR